MATSTNQYRPNYAIPPGWVIEERLTALGISHAEFARRCDRSAKLISEIVSGKAPIEPRTALQFEKVLGVDASILLGIEADYRLHQGRQAETRVASDSAVWAKAFPMNQLVKRGGIGKPSSCGEAVSALLSFFGVASIRAWQTKYNTAHIAYRHSPSFKSDEPALTTWLRLAEINALGQRCADYDESGFKRALKRIRDLTRMPVEEALTEARELCNSVGVALALVEPLPKMRLSGAAWWLSSRRPIIALSVRHKTDDHLWFSLFHESAHILHHGKKRVFVDEITANGEDFEAEADTWAADFLVPRSAWREFVKASAYNEKEVRLFAEQQGVAPGIVVARLQHEKRLRWNRLNDLKVRFQWSQP